MKKFFKDLEILPEGANSSHEKYLHNLWIHLTAFLSSKAPNTSITYSSILKEWCGFLQCEVGTSYAAERLLSATEVHAIAYRNWLEKKTGQKPRFQKRTVGSATQTASKNKSIITSKNQKKTKAKKNDGLEATLSNSTIWKKFAALRRIYRVVIGANLGLKNNPFDADRAPPPPKDSGKKRPTEMVNFDSVMKIINSPDCSTARGRRDRAILAALFGGGLRRSEIVNLRIGDLRKTRNNTPFLYLRSTKGRKDSEQAIPEWAENFIKEVISDRKIEGALEGDYLFISFRGKGGTFATNQPTSDSGVYKMFKQYCLKANAGHFLTPHSARATAITKLLVDGLNHREVQEFSRHSSVSMVEVYDKRRISVDENPGKGLKY